MRNKEVRVLVEKIAKLKKYKIEAIGIVSVLNDFTVADMSDFYVTFCQTVGVWLCALSYAEGGCCS